MCFKTKARTRLILISVIIMMVQLFAVHPAVASDSFFTDVSAQAWYYEPVRVLCEKGIVNGYTDNSFRPARHVQGDELVKLMMAALGFDTPNAAGYWAQDILEQAKEEGLLKGLEDAVYTKPFNRGMSAILISNILEYMKEDIDTSNTPVLYDLGAYTPDEYRDHIMRCVEAGIVIGYEDNTYNYKDNITRAEACTIIQRLIDPSARVYLESTRFLLDREEPIILYKDIQEHEVSKAVKDVVEQLSDGIGCTVIQNRICDDKTYVEVRYHKSEMNLRIEHAMMTFFFYNGPTNYPEKMWGYDTMFFEAEIRGLDWKDGTPYRYYEEKFKNAAVAGLAEFPERYKLADDMLEFRTFIIELPYYERPNRIHKYETDNLRYYFFTDLGATAMFTFTDLR